MGRQGGLAEAYFRRISINVGRQMDVYCSVGLRIVATYVLLNGAFRLFVSFGIMGRRVVFFKSIYCRRLFPLFCERWRCKIRRPFPQGIRLPRRLRSVALPCERDVGYPRTFNGFFFLLLKGVRMERTNDM